MTRRGTAATTEQRAASTYLGALADPLAAWVQSVGPIDAYEAHLPVTVTDPLEWFSYTVTSRQLSRPASRAIYQRLVTRLGGAVTAERVIQTDEQTLREVGLSHRKARTLRTLAARIWEGELSTQALATLTDTELLARLEAVPGIGPASARRFLLHFLHRPDIFPASDPTVREAITVLDRLDRPITPKAAGQRAEAWHPYRSYATAYLWGYVWEHNPTGAEPAGR